MEIHNELHRSSNVVVNFSQIQSPFKREMLPIKLKQTRLKIVSPGQLSTGGGYKVQALLSQKF